MTKEPFVPAIIADKQAGYHIEGWQQRFPHVSAGISSRAGGVSKDHLQSLNCALHVGDIPDKVFANRAIIADQLGIPFEAWTCAEQVHGNRVTTVTVNERGRGRLRREDAIQETDALITNESGVWLTAFFADCVPLYFFDPVQKAVGIAHAGWKGTVLQIADETVKAMAAQFGSKPTDLLAAIGPSIGVCCYEVDEVVASPVQDTWEQLGISEARDKFLVPKSDKPGKFMLNLQHLNREIMIKAGILPSRIEICGMCTSCRTDSFFSHRKEQGRTGRMAAWIGLDLKRS